MILGRKLGNLRPISSKNLFFWRTPDFWEENRKIRESQTNLFCSPPKFFFAGSPMSVRNSAYSDTATLLLTNVPIHNFENMATLSLVSLCFSIYSLMKAFFLHSLASPKHRQSFLNRITKSVVTGFWVIFVNLSLMQYSAHNRERLAQYIANCCCPSYIKSTTLQVSGQCPHRLEKVCQF